jgi:hypothetical protein
MKTSNLPQRELSILGHNQPRSQATPVTPDVFSSLVALQLHQHSCSRSVESCQPRFACPRQHSELLCSAWFLSTWPRSGSRYSWWPFSQFPAAMSARKISPKTDLGLNHDGGAESTSESQLSKTPTSPRRIVRESLAAPVSEFENYPSIS